LLHVSFSYEMADPWLVLRGRSALGVSFLSSMADREALFPSQDDLMGLMAMVFLTWLIPVAVFAFFTILARPKKA
jgi:hypothetical protein